MSSSKSKRTVPIAEKGDDLDPKEILPGRPLQGRGRGSGRLGRREIALQCARARRDRKSVV